MKKILAALLVAATCLAGLQQSARAVTPDELEQARTYAAIVYLRNANPGSDYLDKVSATSRKDLAAKLKDKEKENMKVFNSSLPSASGSEAWGMDELVSFAQKAVKAPDNYTSKGYAANQVSKRVRAMKLTPPKAKNKPETAEQPVEQQPEQTPQATDGAQPAPDTVATAAMPEPFADQEESVAAEDSALLAAEDSLMAGQPAAEQGSAGGSSTIYIIILCILVVLVVALVIYAARYFNRQGEGKGRRAEEEADDDQRQTMRREKSRGDSHPQDYAPEQAVVPQEDMRDRTIESLRAENAELRRTIDEYKYHINYLKAEKEKNDAAELQNRARARATERVAEAPSVAEVAVPDRAATTLNDRFAQRREQSAGIADAPQGGKKARVIYLGRANREGMFIRAERDLNPQHSLFRLSTTDNVTGSYSVAEDAEIEERILSNPELLLAVSCETASGDTYGKEAVVTDAPGTAVFENGRWRVLRPARVRFV